MGVTSHPEDGNTGYRAKDGRSVLLKIVPEELDSDRWDGAQEISKSDWKAYCYGNGHGGFGEGLAWSSPFGES